MPKYHVKVTGAVRAIVYTTVDVVADNEDEARELALEEADAVGYTWDIDPTMWDASDISSDSLKVDEIEEVDDGN